MLKGGEYTTSADVWSIGCILYEMIHSKMYFSIENHQPMVRAVLLNQLTKKVLDHDHQPIKSSCPTKVGEMILKCVNPEKIQRPSILDLLNDSIELNLSFNQDDNVQPMQNLR